MRLSKAVLIYGSAYITRGTTFPVDRDSHVEIYMKVF